MAWLRARDYSQYQGDVDFTQEPIDIALIKMSGGDSGLYLDPNASVNYSKAVAADKGVMGWHFAGGTDPVNEANFAVRAMMPFAQNDTYGLDWEIQNPDPVGWVSAYVNEFHSKSTCYPIVYMNGSTWNAYDWSPVTALCGVWVAWWGISPDANVPIKYPYIIQQYDNSGTVASNGSRVDDDAVFLTMEQFNAYGYHAVVPPQTTTTTTTTTVPETTTTTESSTTTDSTTSTTTTLPPTPEPTPPVQSESFWAVILAIIRRIFW